jgi:hypothetical protein
MHICGAIHLIIFIRRKVIVMSEKKRSLLEFVGKERDRFARYNRSHPHFRRNIFIDAVISTVVVITGFGVINQVSDHARVDALMRSGGVALSSVELINHVEKEGIKAYWFGPIPGYKYTIICTDRKEIIVSYVPQGVSLNHPDRFNLTVETYSNTLSGESAALSNLSTDKDDFTTSDGTEATVYAERPKRVTYAIPSTDKYVEVQYPSSKRIYDVYQDSEKLKLISKR